MTEIDKHTSLLQLTLTGPFEQTFLVLTYQTKLKVFESAKHTSLLQPTLTGH